MRMQEPTADQCSNHEKVIDTEHEVGYAIWYPQMGGDESRKQTLATMDIANTPHQARAGSPSPACAGSALNGGKDNG